MIVVFVNIYVGEKSENEQLSLYYIISMPKTAKKQTSLNKNHQFSLTPLANDLYFKQSVKLSFCKAKEDPKSKSVGKRGKTCKASCLCCPIYNKDNNYATSAFILPDEKRNYIENGLKFKLEHESRIKDYTDQKSQMLVPKPKSKHQYCNVCRVNYQDYLDHIKSDSHKKNIGKAQFTKFIKQFQNKYDQINEGRNSQPKTCFNPDTTQNGSQNESQPQILGLPSKKIKRDFSFAPTICVPVNINSMRNNGQIPPISQISNIAEVHERPYLPVNFFSCEARHQIQNFNHQIFPFISTPIPYGQLGINYPIESNIFMRFPMIFCSSFQNLNPIPSTYFNLPFQSQMPKIENYNM